MFKVKNRSSRKIVDKNRSSRKIVDKIFQLRNNNHYNLCQASQFVVPHFNGVFNGSKSVFFSGPKIWELIPSEIKIPLRRMKNAPAEYADITYEVLAIKYFKVLYF